MNFKTKLIWRILPVFLLAVLDELLYTEAFMKSIRIAEIPFALSGAKRGFNHSRMDSLRRPQEQQQQRNIHAIKRLDEHKGFLKLFNVPSMICFYAARGKWAFIPPFMQNQVDTTARTSFSQNDTFIKQFCQKWTQIKEFFRPLLSTTPVNLEVYTVAPQRCQCANRLSTSEPVPVVYFDRDHIGNISAETIRNTIEFLENFLPPRTKKNKRKNRVRSRVDEMEIE